VAAGWSLAVRGAVRAVLRGGHRGAGAGAHPGAGEYLPFIILLTALFTVSGGIYIRGNLHGSPSMNTGPAGHRHGAGQLMGTTGASMLLIRPADPRQRRPPHKVHVFVFFIFLVSEHRRLADAARRPAAVPGLPEGRQLLLDDARTCGSETLFMRHGAAGPVLRASTASGTARKAVRSRDPTPDTPPCGSRVASTSSCWRRSVGAVLMSGTWKPGIQFTVFHVTLELQNVLRDLALVGDLLPVAAPHVPGVPSRQRLQLGPDPGSGQAVRRHLHHHAPALAILRAGKDGAWRRWSRWSPASRRPAHRRHVLLG
jgi:hypothetical protein